MKITEKVKRTYDIDDDVIEEYFEHMDSEPSIIGLFNYIAHHYYLESFEDSFNDSLLEGNEEELNKLFENYSKSDKQVSND